MRGRSGIRGMLASPSGWARTPHIAAFVAAIASTAGEGVIRRTGAPEKAELLLQVYCYIVASYVEAACLQSHLRPDCPRSVARCARAWRAFLPHRCFGCETCTVML